MTVVRQAAETPAGAGPGRSAGPLPRTGASNAMDLTQVGAALVMIGGVAVYGAKRRKAKSFAGSA